MDGQECWLQEQPEAGTSGSGGLLVTLPRHKIPAMLTSVIVILRIQANLDLKQPVTYKCGRWNVLPGILADIAF